MSGFFSWILGRKSAAPVPVSARPTPAQIDTDSGNEVMYLLDRSGSMSGQEGDLVKAVNASIMQNSRDPLAMISHVGVLTFDDLGFDKIRDFIKMTNVPLLKEAEVKPRGMTPLHDAIGFCIDGVLDRPQKGRKVLIIFTDGLENCSKKYANVTLLRRRIEEFERRGNIILFLAANLDAQEIGTKMGVPAERAINTRANGKPGTSSGLTAAFLAAGGLGLAYYALRSSGADAANLGFKEEDRSAAMGGLGDWRAAVKEDIDGATPESIFNLDPAVAQAIHDRPLDFDPTKGSLDNPDSENARELAELDDDDLEIEDDDSEDEDAEEDDTETNSTDDADEHSGDADSDSDTDSDDSDVVGSLTDAVGSFFGSDD